MWRVPDNIKLFHRNDSGAALLELSVVLPVLLAIGLGVFEFGNLIYNYHLITTGVRDAARYAAGLPRNDAAARTNAQNIAACGVISCGTRRVSWWAPSDIVVNNNVGVIDDGTVCGTSATPYYCRGRDSTTGMIYLVTVSTDVAYSSLGFLQFFGLAPITLHAQHEERIYGVR